jgi:hypothetical protein
MTTVESVTLLRSVELAMRRETQLDWEFADAVYGDVLDMLPDEESPSSAAHGVNTGLAAAEDAVHKAHRQAGTEVTRSAIHDMFVTRRVWPPEERRPDLASFQVHYELRGKDFRNRRTLIEKHAAKSSNGRWSWTDVRRWKSERKPAPMKTFRELFEERVRKAAYQAGKPWHTVADGDRFALAAVCRAIAAEIEAGTFGTDQS